MDRRAFILGATLGRPLCVAPESTKLARIGWLFGASREAAALPLDAFRDELRVLGYVEDRHYAIELRYVSDETEQLASLATDLTRLPVDVIVAPGTPSALAAMNATRRIPIVMVTVADPVGSGLAAAIAVRGHARQRAASLSIARVLFASRPRGRNTGREIERRADPRNAKCLP